MSVLRFISTFFCLIWLGSTFLICSSWHGLNRLMDPVNSSKQASAFSKRLLQTSTTVFQVLSTDSVSARYRADTSVPYITAFVNPCASLRSRAFRRSCKAAIEGFEDRWKARSRRRRRAYRSASGASGSSHAA